MFVCMLKTEAVQQSCYKRTIIIQAGETVRYKYRTKEYIVVSYPNENGLDTRTRIAFDDWENNFEQV